MLDVDDVARIIREFVANEILNGKPGSLNDDTLLLEEGILDSFSLTRLLNFISERFGFEPDPAQMDADQLRSIKAVAEFVRTEAKPSR